MDLMKMLSNKSLFDAIIQELEIEFESTLYPKKCECLQYFGEMSIDILNDTETMKFNFRVQNSREVGTVLFYSPATFRSPLGLVAYRFPEGAMNKRSPSDDYRGGIFVLQDNYPEAIPFFKKVDASIRRALLPPSVRLMQNFQMESTKNATS